MIDMRLELGENDGLLEPLDRSTFESESPKTKLKETIRCRERLESAGSSGDERNTP